MKKVGLVLEGGGGKGAYQIGVWKALRELEIEKYITAVSGTSVGALNAALFYKGSLAAAEEIWSNITDEAVMGLKKHDDYFNGECLFSQEILGNIILDAIRTSDQSDYCRKCYVTCRYRDKDEVRYFEWSKYYDNELKKRILLASSAIPVLFESVNIDGDFYVDGGVKGDNTPIWPLLQYENLSAIIVVHLGTELLELTQSIHEKIIEISPSVDLGGPVTGTLDFDSTSIRERMELGYRDAMKCLVPLAEKLMYENNIGWNVERKYRRKTVYVPSKYKVKNHKGDKAMKEFEFTNAETKKAYEKKYAELQKIAEEKVTDPKYLWDATVQKYAEKMERVQKILRSEGISEQVTSKMFKDIENFLKRCSDAEFHIALVGAIKAGKSTLINALLGYEYASTKVTPETASLTKFKKGRNNYVKVTFYTRNEWDTLWKSANDAKATVFLEEYADLGAENEKENWLGQGEKVIECESRESLVDEIQKWTSSKSVSHYFVKEVEVGLKEFELPEGVVLVDTPGLDDVVEYRSNITREYIDRANAVLVCVKSDALTGQEMGTIYSVFSNTRYNPEKVYIIATQIDSLNRPRENWIEQRKEWLKYLKGRGAYASEKLADKNLVPVSAYLYTLLQNYNSLSDDDDRSWDLNSILMKLRVRDINEHYQELLELTNIAVLKNKIQREIVANYKKLLIEDISGNYELCKESIAEAMQKIKKTQEELIHTSEQSIEDIRKKQAEYEKKYGDAEADKKELDKLLKRLKESMTKRSAELESAIRNLNK